MTAIRSMMWLGVLIGTMLAVDVQAQEAVRLGNVAFEEGRYEEAVRHYEHALRKESTFAVHVNLGHACMKLERWADAATHYRAAIELDATSVTPDIWLFLGQAYYRHRLAQGDSTREALRCLKRRLARVVFGHLHTDQKTHQTACQPAPA